MDSIIIQYKLLMLTKNIDALNKLVQSLTLDEKIELRTRLEELGERVIVSLCYDYKTQKFI